MNIHKIVLESLRSILKEDDGESNLDFGFDEEESFNSGWEGLDDKVTHCSKNYHKPFNQLKPKKDRFFFVRNQYDKVMNGCFIVEVKRFYGIYRDMFSIERTDRIWVSNTILYKYEYSRRGRCIFRFSAKHDDILNHVDISTKSIYDLGYGVISTSIEELMEYYENKGIDFTNVEIKFDSNYEVE